jgi:hypothetical protein
MERGLFADSLAFAQEHLGCDGTTVAVSEPGPYGYAVNLACACGARMVRWVGVEEAERELRGNAARQDRSRGPR